MRLRRLKIAASANDEILVSAIMRLPEKEAELLLVLEARNAMLERLEFCRVNRGIIS